MSPSVENITFPARARTETNLGDFDFGAVSIFVDSHDINIIKSIVRRFRIAPFVLTCQ